MTTPVPGATQISPAPTDEEAAVIVAAVDGLWPRPAAAEPPSRRVAVWRFSGRWWARPMAVRRDRPFR